MGVGALENLKRLFGGGSLSDQEKHRLRCEALLITLARASHADTNIGQVEVETIRRIYKVETGEDIDAAEVRVAAHSDVYETTPLESYLKKAASNLSAEDCCMIVRALAAVIRANNKISPGEIEFFNTVAEALDLEPAQIAQLGT